MNNQQNPPQSPLTLPFGLSVERLTIWLVLMLVAYSLRGFFTTVFMTFILTYVVSKAVGFLTDARNHPENEERWIRKPLVVFVYLMMLSVGYLAAQSIIPLAIEQGRW